MFDDQRHIEIAPPLTVEERLGEIERLCREMKTDLLEVRALHEQTKHILNDLIRSLQAIKKYD